MFGPEIPNCRVSSTPSALRACLLSRAGEASRPVQGPHGGGLDAVLSGRLDPAKEVPMMTCGAAPCSHLHDEEIFFCFERLEGVFVTKLLSHPRPQEGIGTSCSCLRPCRSSGRADGRGRGAFRAGAALSSWNPGQVLDAVRAEGCSWAPLLWSRCRHR